MYSILTISLFVISYTGKAIPLIESNLLIISIILLVFGLLGLTMQQNQIYLQIDAKIQNFYQKYIILNT